MVGIGRDLAGEEVAQKSVGVEKERSVRAWQGRGIEKKSLGSGRNRHSMERGWQCRTPRRPRVATSGMGKARGCGGYGWIG